MYEFRRYGQDNRLTVFQAVDALRQQGYRTLFRLDGSRLTCPAGTFGTDEFEIIEIYRVRKDESETDEMVVYAICSNLKGILIRRRNGDGGPGSLLPAEPGQT